MHRYFKKARIDDEDEEGGSDSNSNDNQTERPAHSTQSQHSSSNQTQLPNDNRHCEVVKNSEDLMGQNQVIQASLSKHPEHAKSEEYRTCLDLALECMRMILSQGFEFEGFDEYESETCIKREDLQGLIDIVGKDVPNEMTSPAFQKSIAHVCASETTNEIIKEVGDDVFGIVVDKADGRLNDLLIIALRYVDPKGSVRERLLDVADVTEHRTTSSFLEVLVSTLGKYGLCLGRIRGQSYNGTSVGKNRFGCMKTLIQEKNNLAYHVHCFAHPLESVLVHAATSNVDVHVFFYNLTRAVNAIGWSDIRPEWLTKEDIYQVASAFCQDEFKSEQGQARYSFTGAGSIGCGCRTSTLVNLVKLFTQVTELLEFLENDPRSSQKGEAGSILDKLESYEFIFMLLLMKNILVITCDLSQALQRHDEDLLNATKLVGIAKQQLQALRDEGWEDFLSEFYLFCDKEGFYKLNMEELYARKSQYISPDLTNLQYYKCECFYKVLDLVIEELDRRFNTASTELLRCVACLNPSEMFSAFDKKSLMKLAYDFYPNDFSDVDPVILDNQLENFITDLQSDDRFSELKGLVDLSTKLVETGKHTTYPYVYMLVRLALILPIATAYGKQASSKMRYIKNVSKDRRYDKWMHDCLVTCMERDVFSTISKEAILAPCLELS